MSDVAMDRNVPRGALIGVAALLLFTIVAAAFGRMTGIGTVQTRPAAPVQSALLNFEDRTRGGIAVIAPDTRQVLTVIAAGEDGFIRTALRSLAFDRQRHGVGAAPPFRVATWSDGRATVDDPSTGRSIDLAAFGTSSKQAFVNLLSLRGQP